jgi:uncharacterized damage-inducible protein DinB
MARVETPRSADERTMLMAWLEWERETMVDKITGLTEEQARWKPAPTANSLLGLILHLAAVESWWFSECFVGAPDDFPKWGDHENDRDWEMKPSEEHTIEWGVALYRRYWQRGNEIAAAADLDAIGKHERAVKNNISMRWILVHMIEETARHAGHADITRELIDGKTGM